MESTKEETPDKKEQPQENTQQPVPTELKVEETQNNQSQTIKASKPKKIQYLNQKVYFPMNMPDKIEFIYNLFYNEELGYVINNAPLYKSSTIYEVGKYFKIKLKYILEICSGILYYLFKNFRINKEEDEERTTEEILNSGEINSYKEMCELYKDLCQSSGIKIIIINGYKSVKFTRKIR